MTARGPGDACRSPTTAYIGIGSNLDGPVEQVKRALRSLAALAETRLTGYSPLYRNPAMGCAEQPDYVNAVAAIETRLGSHELLAEMQAIESRQGRVRGDVRWPSRTIDLDLLMYGNMRIADERLTVPHPGLCERAFVLYPLADIAPGLDVPGSGPLAELLRGIPGDALEMIEEGGSSIADSET